MDLSKERDRASPSAKMKVLTLMNAIHNYMSGEAFFLPILGVSRREYISRTKETIKFFTLSNFIETDPDIFYFANPEIVSPASLILDQIILSPSGCH